MALEWEFLPNNANEEEGLSDPGIETFKGAPYSGLARECAQNSIDAAAKMPDGSHARVRLVFRQIHVPRGSVPGVDSLQRALQACLARSKRRSLKKDIDFFQNACRLIEKPRINVMLVEDYGTAGLVGPSVPGKPFHALVKASGVSQKASADAGGSFGIGKNAAFAVSMLRSVFYSTIYKVDGKPSFLGQGKTVLVSHDGADGKAHRATGYWGWRNFAPVSDPSLIAEWLRRSEVGTTVASIGFREEESWEWRMVESLARNFFAAIRDGKVEFEVRSECGDPIIIRNDTFDDILVSKELAKVAEMSGTLHDLDFARAMDRARASSEAKEFERSFQGLGSFRLKILQGHGFPQRIGFLRNGMYLTDNLRSFGHPFARFPLCMDFVGIVEPDDQEAKKNIRELESPRHDELSAERMDDPAIRARITSAMKQLAAWIRATVKESTSAPSEAEIQLDEMNRFFAAVGGDDAIPDPGNGESNPEKIRLRAKPLDSGRVGSGPDGESGSAGGRKSGGKGDGRTTGDRPGVGRGLKGGRGGKSIPFSRLKTFTPSQGEDNRRKIVLVPHASGAARLELIAAGVSEDVSLGIVGINGQRCAKAPVLDFTEGELWEVIVDLSETYRGPVRVVLSIPEEAADAD